MTQIIVLPHVELCPDGSVIEAAPGTTICDSLLENGIDIEHACEKSCACTTCHVIVREGFGSLNPAEDEEEDLLDKALERQPNNPDLLYDHGMAAEKIDRARGIEPLALDTLA